MFTRKDIEQGIREGIRQYKELHGDKKVDIDTNFEVVADQIIERMVACES